jgi:hypothetical protein
MIVSNATEPDSFFYEYMGDGLDWAILKPLIIKLNDTLLTSVNGVSMSGIGTTHTEANVKLRYERYLVNTPTIKKIPYIFTKSIDVNVDGNFYDERPPIVEPFSTSALKDINLYEDKKTKENSIINYQKGANIKQYGRRKGNMQYLEDS